MYWMRISLPSGWERTSLVSMSSPADGAICSLSNISRKATSMLLRAFASSLAAVATAASRLSTSPNSMGGMVISMVLRRGSMRASFAISGVVMYGSLEKE